MTTPIGGVDVFDCSDVLGLSSGIEVIIGNRGPGQASCDRVEVLKPLDTASPGYLSLAFHRTRVQRIDILFFAPNLADASIIEIVFELSLRQSLVVGVSQEFDDDRLVERVTFLPNRIVATLQPSGAVADISCGG